MSDESPDIQGTPDAAPRHAAQPVSDAASGPATPPATQNVAMPPAEQSQPAPAPVAAAPAAAQPAPAPVASSSLDDTDPAGTPMQMQQVLDVSSRTDSDTDEGSTALLSWAARSDVGLVRPHNEDSFLVRAPLFAVCDGMGGHAAGEVASSIAVRTIAEMTPAHATDVDLGAAVEAANASIIGAADSGEGKPGMGCTATAAIIEGTRMVVAHVGDSRIYILHAGTLVRITRDHSYVEELVDAGEITADEARVHPSRSIITRALGSDPDMYADHFTLDVEKGDRIIICSDGLSSMIPDSDIEGLACTSPTPKECTDRLVGAALAEGGHDNVTVVTIDVIEDGLAAKHRAVSRRNMVHWLILVGCVIAILAGGAAFFVSNSWYVGNNLGTVGVYQGVKANFLGIGLSHLTETTDIQVADLPVSTQKLLAEGIRVSSQEEADGTIESYRTQISTDKQKTAETADSAKVATTAAQSTAVAETSSSDATSTDTAATTQQGGE